MKFDEVTQKVIPETLSKEEAKQFIKFLEKERGRHCDEVGIAEDMANDDSFHYAYREFWTTAAIRHKQDIEDTEKLIARVKDIFELAPSAGKE